MSRVRTLPYMLRRTANAFAVAAVLALVLGGAFASTALAATGGRAEVEPRFQLTGSHGYRILVSARERTVTIGVSKGNSRRAGSSTTYVARGTAGTHGFSADFHQFGRVNVHFHRTSGAVRGLPPDCFGGNGGADTIEGYFTGSFEFEGEQGYTEVQTNRVKGEMVLPPTEQCPLVAGGANPLVENKSAELPPAKTRMTLEAIEQGRHRRPCLRRPPRGQDRLLRRTLRHDRADRDPQHRLRPRAAEELRLRLAGQLRQGHAAEALLRHRDPGTRQGRQAHLVRRPRGVVPRPGQGRPDRDRIPHDARPQLPLAPDHGRAPGQPALPSGAGSPRRSTAVGVATS